MKSIACLSLFTGGKVTCLKSAITFGTFNSRLSKKPRDKKGKCKLFSLIYIHNIYKFALQKKDERALVQRRGKLCTACHCAEGVLRIEVTSFQYSSVP